MINFNYHTYVFSAWLAIWLIAGSIVGSRFLYFREVECLEQVTCPKGMIDPNICVSIIDPQGVKSIGNLELFLKIDKYPTKCWTTGFSITTIDPKVVRNKTLIILSTLYPIYILINLISFYAFRYRYRDTPIFYHKSILGSDNGAKTFKIIKIIILITLIAYISFLIIYGAMAIKQKQVTCTNYVPIKLSNVTAYISTVDWNGYENLIPVSGTSPISYTSYQPTTLPQPCWLSTTISFYDPLTLFKSASLITLSILLTALLYFLISKYIYYNLYTTSQNLEQLLNYASDEIIFSH